MAELGRVQFGDATIEYDVHRSERRKKTVQITMYGGRVLVAAPSNTPDSKLEAIVRKRAPWILRQAPDAVLQVPRKRFVSGETLLYLGRNVRLIVEPADVRMPEVRFATGAFESPCPLGWTNPSVTTGSGRRLFNGTDSGPHSVYPRRSNSGGKGWAGRKRPECWSATSDSGGAAAPPTAPSASTGVS